MPVGYGGHEHRKALLGGDRVIDLYQIALTLAFGGTRSGWVSAIRSAALTFVPALPLSLPEDVWTRTPQTGLRGLTCSENASARVAYLPANLDRRFARDQLPDHGDLLTALARWCLHEDVPTDARPCKNRGEARSGEPGRQTHTMRAWTFQMTTCVRAYECCARSKRIARTSRASRRNSVASCSPSPASSPKPERHDLVRMAKAFRRAEREAAKEHDRKAIEQAGLRVQRRSPVFAPLWLEPPKPEDLDDRPRLNQERDCYVCKQPFCQGASLLRFDVRAVRRLQLRQA